MSRVLFDARYQEWVSNQKGKNTREVTNEEHDEIVDYLTTHEEGTAGT